MRVSRKQLSIVANPFAAPLSAEGRCTALCPSDPAEGGGRYIGARSVARPDPARKSLLASGGRRMGRDKVTVAYDLRPVTVADTSYYRQRLAAGDAFAAEGAPVKLLGAALASLRAFEAEGGDREEALTAWRAQGLAAVAEIVVAMPRKSEGTAIEGVLGDVVSVHLEGAVS